MTDASTASILAICFVLYFLFDFLERRAKMNDESFRSWKPPPREPGEPMAIYFCPDCGFDCNIGGICPNPKHTEPIEMIERNLANKCQEPGTTDAIRKIFENEPRESNL